MAKDILAVYDACQSYIERFINYAHFKNHLNFEMEGYTDLTILMNALKNNKIKAVLFSLSETDKKENERVIDSLTQLRLSDLKLILMGEQPAAGQEEKDTNVEFLYKYQSMEMILAQIEGLMKEENNSGMIFPGRESLHVSGLFSPIDKRSHPREAAILAKQFQSTDPFCTQKMLYINLEQFPGVNAWLDYQGDTSISNVIYYYKTNPAGLRESLIRTRGGYMGMDVLTAPVEAEDLEEIGRKGWPDFLAALSAAGDYPNILIDNTVIRREIIDVIFEYGNLYIPALPYSKKGTFSEDSAEMTERLREFRSYIRNIGPESWQDKILEIQLRDPDIRGWYESGR